MDGVRSAYSRHPLAFRDLGFATMSAGNASFVMVPPATFVRSISRSHRELSALRLDIRSWLSDNDAVSGPSPVDVDVVVTELVANAIDHTTTSAIDVVVSVQPDRVRVEVANDVGHERPVLTSEWSGAGERGRGLRLVAALSAELRMAGDDERSVVVAELLADRQPVGES